MKEKIKLTEQVYLFRFGLIQPKEINFIPGQYLILKIKDKSRLYSIASSSFIKDSFDLIVEIVEGGLASTYLLNLTPKEEVLFQGPAGVFFLRKTPLNKIFLATGTGIAPIFSMIESSFALYKKKGDLPNFTLFWGLRHLSDLYLYDKLKKIKDASEKKFDFWICFSRETNLKGEFFIDGRVNVGLERVIRKEDFKDFEFYLCGGREVIESLKNYLLERGAVKEKIYFEKF
ncbi:MAG: FAD-dependent oxidoreductase [Candidatus Omnitrophica bacterium]|nr:FAD-dependent oxidoreductase [Candidatus Omnitrophota bacterium]